MHPCIHVSMHPCILAHMHLCIHAAMHICIFASVHPCIHASMRQCIHASMHTCIHASMHPCTHASMHPCILLHMHPCIYAYIHICIHAYVHTCIHAYMRSCIHTSMHPCIHAHMHPCIHASMHPCIHASLHPCIHTYMHICIFAYMHTCIHAYMHPFCISGSMGSWGNQGATCLVIMSHSRYHYVLLSGTRSISQTIFPDKYRQFFDPPLAQNSICFCSKSAPETHYGQIGHKQISILTKSQLPNPKLRPINSQRTIPKSVAINRPQSTSPQTLLKPFKIKDLSLLTHLYMKSVSR